MILVGAKRIGNHRPLPLNRRVLRISKQSLKKATESMPNSEHVYEVRPRKDKRGVNLISDALPFGRLWVPHLTQARQ